MHPPLKIAIQGDRGSFHEIAAKAFYQHPYQLSYCQSFEDVFFLLASRQVDKILVATSNTTHGPIHEVAALLAKYPVKRDGEYHLPIQQHLIGLPGTQIKDVRAIISHPVALSQCSVFTQAMNYAEKIHFHDTAAAVQYVKKHNNTQFVAIASSAAAELHGLEIVLPSIQNSTKNTTIFKSYTL